MNDFDDVLLMRVGDKVYFIHFDVLGEVRLDKLTCLKHVAYVRIHNTLPFSVQSVMQGRVFMTLSEVASFASEPGASSYRRRSIKNLCGMFCGRQDIGRVW